ncbi:MAG: hypothetical protein ACFFF9_10025 [Candidatus Thorarchaeota archaeon]
METIALCDVDEDEVKGILYFFPKIWQKDSSIFDAGFFSIFNKFGESEDLLFGVNVFYHGNATRVVIILSEYMRESRTATFTINVKQVVGIFAPCDDEKGEEKIKSMLENLTYEQLKEFAVSVRHLEDDRLFLCPICGAQYRMRVLHVSADGRIECQNCGRLFDPMELDMAPRRDSSNP